jgi:ubiquitin carboxyl-terminal hydrolase 5/13
MMTAMGFPEKKCIKALKNCDMNVERATDWLFSHMDDPDSEADADGDSVMADDSAPYLCDKPGVYNL